MAEKPADSARGTRRSDSAADGALTQPTVELNALPGGRPPGPRVPDAPTVEQPIVEQPTVEQPIVQPSTAAARRSRRAANRSADVFDEPTVEQPVVRPAAVRPDTADANLPAGPAQPPAGPAGTAAGPAQPPAGPAATAPGPARTAPPDEPDRFIALARRYGWVVAAGSVAAVALLCSAPFVSGNGLLWNPASSTGSPVTPTVTADSAPTATVTPEVTDTSPAAGNSGESPEVRQADPPAAPPEQPASDPAPPPPPSEDPPASSAAPPGGGEPVLLGPDNSDDLRGMLDSYCKQEHGGEWMAWPREWPGNGTDWECVRPWTHHDRDLDVRRACASRYGEPVIAEAGSRRDAYSWRCYRG
ncbi:hypothetical protein EDC02_2792 [Micromonospora sp. Llam0]|uniref:hypothetical protein n=1 Tax=Micromonospora sp. Llam0 TaxID=2485143 RepID=UPI000F4835A8|nr:hypothetical protein [Micromonospora sp. Llam0]ROO60874.1 hypothetical protein EDC02_2792 [Micromonospora sp. Llam0]